MIKKLKALILFVGFVGPVADLIRAIAAVRLQAPRIAAELYTACRRHVDFFFNAIQSEINVEIDTEPALAALKLAIENLEKKIDEAAASGAFKAIAILTLALTFAPAISAQAQPQFALELGGAMYVSSAPHSAAYLTGLLPIDAASKTRLYGTVQMRPVALNQVTYSTRGGVERELYADRRVALNVHGQGGVATGPSATAGIFAGGGNVIITIKKGFALAVAVEALASPVIGGWEPQGRLGLRYTFGQ